MPTKIDQLIRSRRKSILIKVDDEGRVVVRAPLRLNLYYINQFIISKSAWIESRKKEVESLRSQIHRFYTGEVFYYLGNSVELVLVEKQATSLQFSEEFFLRKTDVQRGMEIFTSWYKRQARKILFSRAEELAKQLNMHYKKLRLSSARTRWGSCSSTGTISLTWRLVMTPPKIIDYVIIHELVHLEIRNHSKLFWNRVGQLDPDFKMKRKWLKENALIVKL